MKKTLIIILVILVLGAVLYVERHELKSMIGGSATPIVMQVTPTLAPMAAAPSDNIYLVKADAVKGKYLTDFAGITLYTFDKDIHGVSNCSSLCVNVWPVYTSGATAQKTFPANIMVITRADGIKQFAWKGMPLYYHATDTKVGDMTGDGIGGAWHMVKL